MTKYDKNTDWFEMWCNDRRSMIATMVNNMCADLESGYDYFGRNIQKQQQDINRYKQEYETQLMAFATMEHDRINKWCYLDLIRRGAIE